MKEYKIKDILRRNQLNKLGGINSPISPSSVQSSSYQLTPICSSTYGSFQDTILLWVDKQPIFEVGVNDYYYYQDNLHNRLGDFARANTYLPKLREPHQAKLIKKEKTEIVRERRSRFDKNRDQLMLAMLHAGRAYICAHSTCGEMRKLHVDHIVPLSKGGSDELSNLQFLCKQHNIEKGSKYPDS